jgi:hypothetical protein
MNSITAQSTRQRSSFHDLNAIRVIATTVGVILGLSGVNHGLFEFLQGNKPTPGLIIQAIGKGQRFWPLGTEEAFTIVPNFMISGLLSMIVGLVIVIWSLWFLPSKRGPAIFLGLFVLLFLVGGGIGQIAFFLPAWAFAGHMNAPPNWWMKVLPRRTWTFLSRLWIVTLVLASLLILFGLEIAILGVVPGMTDPERIQSTGMLLVFSSALLYVIAFVAGIGHELRRADQRS